MVDKIFCGKQALNYKNTYKSAFLGQAHMIITYPMCNMTKVINVSLKVFNNMKYPNKTTIIS